MQARQEAGEETEFCIQAFLSLISVPVSGRGRGRTAASLHRGLQVRVAGEWRHQGALQDQHRPRHPEDHHHRGGVSDAYQLPASDRARVPFHGYPRAGPSMHGLESEDPQHPLPQHPDPPRHDGLLLYGDSETGERIHLCDKEA